MDAGARRAKHRAGAGTGLGRRRERKPPSPGADANPGHRRKGGLARPPASGGGPWPRRKRRRPGRRREPGYETIAFGRPNGECGRPKRANCLAFALGHGTGGAAAGRAPARRKEARGGRSSRGERAAREGEKEGLVAGEGEGEGLAAACWPRRHARAARGERGGRTAGRRRGTPAPAAPASAPALGCGRAARPHRPPCPRRAGHRPREQGRRGAEIPAACLAAPRPQPRPASPRPIPGHGPPCRASSPAATALAWRRRRTPLARPSLTRTLPPRSLAALVVRALPPCLLCHHVASAAAPWLGARAAASFGLRTRLSREAGRHAVSTRRPAGQARRTWTPSRRDPSTPANRGGRARRGRLGGKRRRRGGPEGRYGEEGPRRRGWRSGCRSGSSAAAQGISGARPRCTVARPRRCSGMQRREIGRRRCRERGPEGAWGVKKSDMWAPRLGSWNRGWI
ncbi:hypothetical protein PVAP13_6NG320468 [Panicum virgatum]|uniref:Uncharacterized protein n=1 Tax=Panicum virgatum TaxID=38727 RepID=A0A8T0R574_PANVG|nr:hypothetical protein PVAP13_6NG320468 [Panicum virgatum]